MSSIDDLNGRSLYEVAVDLAEKNRESCKRSMIKQLDVLLEVGWISEEKRQSFIELAERDLNKTLDEVFELYRKYKERESTRSGVGIQEGYGGRLMYPLKLGRLEELEGIYPGAGDLLERYTVDATGFDSRQLLRAWMDDIMEGSALVRRGLREGGESVARQVLGDNPSKRDVVLFTIVALVRTRSKRRTSTDIVGGWWNVLTGSHKRVSEFGEGSNICSTEAILCQLLAKLYGMEGVIKKTHIREDKPNQPHNYFQVDDYSGDGAGPVLDVAGCPHLWGFVRDPERYELEVKRGQEWLRIRRASEVVGWEERQSSLTDFDREFIEFSRGR